jgi:DNA-binding LytR/AlgR family response regulator
MNQRITYKCIIVDDEPLATQLLENYVSKISELELVGMFSSALDAQRFLNDNKIDVMFLDINMPVLSGIEFLKILNNKPYTILTTAYSEFAVDAFSMEVEDYLLKPIAFDRFYKSVQKLLRKLQPSTVKISSNSIQEKEEEDDYFFVKADLKIIKIAFTDVLYIEGLREYVGINTAKERIVTLIAMIKLLEVLPEDQFVRIHRSYIVNLKHVKSVYGNTVVLNNGKELPISKGQKEEFLLRINEKKLF